MSTRPIGLSRPAEYIDDRIARIRYLTNNGESGRGVMKIQDFATYSGISLSFLSKFLRGDLRNPGFQSMVRMDTALERLEKDKNLMRAAAAVHIIAEEQKAIKPIDFDAIFP